MPAELQRQIRVFLRIRVHGYTYKGVRASFIRQYGRTSEGTRGPGDPDARPRVARRSGWIRTEKFRRRTRGGFWRHGSRQGLYPNDRGKAMAKTHVTRGGYLSLVQCFAQVFGAAYLLVELTGFRPASPPRRLPARGSEDPRRVEAGRLRRQPVPQPHARCYRPRRVPELPRLAGLCPGMGGVSACR